MPNTLLEIVADLSARGNREWVRMAEELRPTVSYGMIAALGRGTYKSSPTLRKIEAIATWLKKNPR